MILNTIIILRTLSKIKTRFCFLLLFIIFIVSCQPEVKKQVIVKVDKPQDVQLELHNELNEWLSNQDSIIIVDSTTLSCFKYFRQLYSDSLLWFSKTQLNLLGDSLISIIKHAEYYGLYPDDYHLTPIINYIDSIHANKKYINITALVNADLLLSDAYFLLGAHLNKGRFYADSLLLQTNFKKLPRGWDSLLVSGYHSKQLKAVLDSLEPKFYNYRMLKQELAHILNDKNQFNMDSIPFTSEKDSLLKHQHIISSLIKQGFYDSTSKANDSLKLARALKKLQTKWFIQPDGKIGNYTMQALSYNREKVIKQICMAMERWRWENTFPEKYVFINIPAFWLTVFEKDTVVMQSAVVCGKPDHQTPILKSKIDHILIYPYWNVPISIATKEILPLVKKDTSYIRKKNFEVIGASNKVLDYTKLPWKKYTEDYLPVRFRQRIGEENSLGIVKFNFHNPFGVYLHDTNSKRYFKTSNRAQSHGCIRLENFVEFADFLIRDDSLNYRHDSLQVYFTKQEQKKIKLKRPLVPIYTRYYTAHADSTGLKLYLDIYRKDEEMMKMIYK